MSLSTNAGAGSDGNFDSYLQDAPKVGSFDLINMIIISVFMATLTAVVSIYVYVKIYLLRTFQKVKPQKCYVQIIGARGKKPL